VPTVRKEERIIQKIVSIERKVKKMVEVCRYETHVVQKPVTKIIEEVVEIPKIKLVEVGSFPFQS